KECMSNSPPSDLASKLDEALSKFGELSGQQNSDLIEGFCTITPPNIPDVDRTMDWVTIRDRGRRGGQVVRPGNILLNWSKLFRALASMVLTGAGAAANPWFVVLGGLVIWNDLYGMAKIDLDPEHAVAFQAMWQNHDGQQRISEDKAWKLTNGALKELDLNRLNKANFAMIVDELSRIGCVEIKDGEIWLRQWIRRGWP
ncbi:MAG: hypothetical protein K8F25_15990, partial [Fimbriimonadaceae bacterium]|nr:hypothetical protein [Alphaproteobacteria bacterium]